MDHDTAPHEPASAPIGYLNGTPIRHLPFIDDDTAASIYRQARVSGLTPLDVYSATAFNKAADPIFGWQYAALEEFAKQVPSRPLAREVREIVILFGGAATETGNPATGNAETVREDTKPSDRSGTVVRHNSNTRSGPEAGLHSHPEA